jgi:hypothetical protein
MIGIICVDGVSFSKEFDGKGRSVCIVRGFWF